MSRLRSSTRSSSLGLLIRYLEMSWTTDVLMNKLMSLSVQGGLVVSVRVLSVACRSKSVDLCTMAFRTSYEEVCIYSSRDFTHSLLSSVINSGKSVSNKTFGNFILLWSKQYSNHKRFTKNGSAVGTCGSVSYGRRLSFGRIKSDAISKANST